MDYSRETVIDLPRDRVVALFEDDANRGGQLVGEVVDRTRRSERHRSRQEALAGVAS